MEQKDTEKAENENYGSAPQNLKHRQCTAGVSIYMTRGWNAQLDEGNASRRSRAAEFTGRFQKMLDLWIGLHGVFFCCSSLKSDYPFTSQAWISSATRF